MNKSIYLINSTPFCKFIIIYYQFNYIKRKDIETDLFQFSFGMNYTKNKEITNL